MYDTVEKEKSTGVPQEDGTANMMVEKENSTGVPKEDGALNEAAAEFEEVSALPRVMIPSLALEDFTPPPLQPF